MAYVLESAGPIVLPFTDENEKTLTQKPDPINVGSPGINELTMVDNRRSVKTPKDVYEILPPYIKKITERP
jgi:hypothetical protein